MSFLGSVFDSLPIVGHIKGTVHYAMGDNEAGRAAMVASSRTVCVTAGAVGGFCVGGPLGAAAGGISAGTAMDGV